MTAVLVIFDYDLLEYVKELDFTVYKDEYSLTYPFFIIADNEEDARTLLNVETANCLIKTKLNPEFPWYNRVQPLGYTLKKVEVA